MSAIIQGMTFGDREVIISVGYFFGADIPILFEKCHPKYVVAYEPLLKVYFAYKRAGEPYKQFYPVQKAVGGSSGTAILAQASTRSTTTLTGTEKGKGRTEVEVVGINDVLRGVLKKYGKIDRLLLNCEGAEIDIISNVELSFLEKCENIFVQFHDFIPELGIKPKQKLRCIKKLEHFHEAQVVKKKYSKYHFKRKPR